MEKKNVPANNIIEQIQACTECGACLDACPTFRVTKDALLSPAERLKTAAKILAGERVDEKMRESMYNCPKCLQCENVCPEEIRVTEIVHAARVALAETGQGPLSGHEKVIKGLLAKGNAVNGDPARRLDWLPEPYTPKESDTLLFLGCLPSYLVKNAARSTYLALKKLGADFMILEDEGCCGTYLYESGRVDLASEYFRKNVERFSSIGVRRLIVPCNGCLKCFKRFYPALLGETGFEVRHALEVIAGLVLEKPGVLDKIRGRVTCQDACRLARGEKIHEEPRALLRACGLELAEMERNRGEAACCGAGGGIRSVFRELSTQIAEGLLASAPAEELVTACPFCAFHLGYAAKKTRPGMSVSYFAEKVLEALPD